MSGFGTFYGFFEKKNPLVLILYIHPSVCLQHFEINIFFKLTAVEILNCRFCFLFSFVDGLRVVAPCGEPNQKK